MITEQDLQEAIAACEGELRPNASTCMKLASFYTIRDHLSGRGSPDKNYSGAAVPPDNMRSYVQADDGSASEFMRLVSVVDINDAVAIMDELMDTIQVMNPRLYAGVIRKLKNVI